MLIFSDRAREILAQGCREARHEWKIFLEAVLLEYRCGNLKGALQKGEEALVCHPGTGRLWAVLIQLRQQDGEAAQLAVFQQAINEVGFGLVFSAAHFDVRFPSLAKYGAKALVSR